MAHDASRYRDTCEYFCSGIIWLCKQHRDTALNLLSNENAPWTTHVFKGKLSNNPSTPSDDNVSVYQLNNFVYWCPSKIVVVKKTRYIWTSSLIGQYFPELYHVVKREKGAGYFITIASDQLVPLYNYQSQQIISNISIISLHTHPSPKHVLKSLCCSYFHFFR